MAASMHDATLLQSSGQPPLLVPRKWVWGVLQHIGAAQADVLPVRIQNQDYLVGSEVEESLRPLMGRVVVVMARGVRYYAGELTDPENIALAWSLLGGMA